MKATLATTVSMLSLLWLGACAVDDVAEPVAATDLELYAPTTCSLAGERICGGTCAKGSTCTLKNAGADQTPTCACVPDYIRDCTPAASGSVCFVGGRDPSDPTGCQTFDCGVGYECVQQAPRSFLCRKLAPRR